MKKVIICAMLFATMLCGCATSSNNKSDAGYIDNFVCVDYGYNGYVYVDKNTRVMYWRNGNGGISVILNADGTPMLWEGDLE